MKTATYLDLTEKDVEKLKRIAATAASMDDFIDTVFRSGGRIERLRADFLRETYISLHPLLNLIGDKRKQSI